VNADLLLPPERAFEYLEPCSTRPNLLIMDVERESICASGTPEHQHRHPLAHPFTYIHIHSLHPFTSTHYIHSHPLSHPLTTSIIHTFTSTHYIHSHPHTHIHTHTHTHTHVETLGQKKHSHREEGGGENR
jgi:hypothetical protein